MQRLSTDEVIARVPLTRLASAATLACGLLLSACGGGGDSTTPTGSTATPMSQADATADAANASQVGIDSTDSLDTIYDTTQALAVSSAIPTSDPGRAHAMAAAAPITNTVVDCAGGGTATLSITGGTLLNQLNGGLDAGEHYSVTYAQCTGRAGFAQLNGQVEMDVVSVSSDASPTTAVSIAVTNLSVTLPRGSAVLNGSANLSRSVVTAGGVTTTTSNVTAPSVTLATAFNSRSATFTLSDLDATRTVESTAGVTTGSQFSGHHTLSGTANGRSFTLTASTTGAVSYDSTGAPIAGQWTVVRPAATIATVVANGVVIITVDEGNDGTIDHTWTFPTAQLEASAG